MGLKKENRMKKNIFKILALICCLLATSSSQAMMSAFTVACYFVNQFEKSKIIKEKKEGFLKTLTNTTNQTTSEFSQEQIKAIKILQKILPIWKAAGATHAELFAYPLHGKLRTEIRLLNRKQDFIGGMTLPDNTGKVTEFYHKLVNQPDFSRMEIMLENVHYSLLKTNPSHE